MTSRTSPIEQDDWQERCLQRLRLDASDTLANLLQQDTSVQITDQFPPAQEFRRPDGIGPNRVRIRTPDNAETPSDAGAARPSKSARRYTAASGSIRRLLKRSGSREPRAGRLRAYTSAAPSDTARQLSVISAEFQRFLASKAEQLRVSRQLGTLSDEQLQDQFMRDVGATLRDIADQLRVLNQQKEQEKAEASGQNRAMPVRVFSAAARTMKAASSRVLSLFG